MRCCPSNKFPSSQFVPAIPHLFDLSLRPINKVNNILRGNQKIKMRLAVILVWWQSFSTLLQISVTKRAEWRCDQRVKLKSNLQDSKPGKTV